MSDHAEIIAFDPNRRRRPRKPVAEDPRPG